MGAFFILLVLVGIGVGLYYLNDFSNKEVHRQRFSGFEDRNDDEDALLTMFRRQADASKIFEKIGCYVSDVEVVAGEQKEVLHFPLIQDTKKTSTGVEFIFSMPTGMSGKQFVEAIDQGGDLFPHLNVNYRAEEMNSGRAKIVAVTRRGGERNAGTNIFD